MEVGYDDASESRWRELDVGPNPEIVDRLEGVDNRDLGRLHAFLEPACRNPGSVYGSICNAITAMGEDLGTGSLNGTGVTGPAGELYFFQDGDLRALKTEVSLKDFKENDNGKISVLRHYYGKLPDESGVPRSGLSVMAHALDSFESVNEPGTSPFEVEVTGEEMMQLYRSLQEFQDVYADETPVDG